MEPKKNLVVAFDLDGVIASPLFDGALMNLRILKEHFLKNLSRDRRYFYPKLKAERLAWLFLNRRRSPTRELKSIEEFKGHAAAQLILLTGRFKFLEKDTRRWLEDYGLNSVFDKTLINTDDLDPALFKIEILSQFAADYYLDDDLEVLLRIKDRVKTKLNLLGRKKGPETIGSFTSIKGFLAFIEKTFPDSTSSFKRHE